MKKISPIHPGEILLEEFMKPAGITQYRLAKEIAVEPRRINAIILGKRTITADTSLRLARFFGVSDRFFLNLQAQYDLEVQREALGGRLGQIRVLTSSGTLPVAAAPSDWRGKR